MGKNNFLGLKDSKLVKGRLENFNVDAFEEEDDEKVESS